MDVVAPIKLAMIAPIAFVDPTVAVSTLNVSPEIVSTCPPLSVIVCTPVTTKSPLASGVKVCVPMTRLPSVLRDAVCVPMTTAPWGFVVSVWTSEMGIGVIVCTPVTTKSPFASGVMVCVPMTRSPSVLRDAVCVPMTTLPCGFVVSVCTS